MHCPNCGGTTTAPTGSCTLCGSRIRDDGVTVAAGVVTPPLPDQPTISGSEPTRLSDSPAAPTDGMSAASSRAPLGIGHSFGPRYQILRLLGAGGMGSVYQAWDEELGVAVALKVIRPDITADPLAAAELARRFKRELLLAREVTHKNVVRIHDLGEIDGIKYITMSYVDGSDLATLLSKEGRLPVPRALRIARNIAAGLMAAHEAGVVHRDLKPANVMVDEEDCAQIMDFGIARSILRAGHEERHRSEPGTRGLTDWRSRDAETMAGSVVGTIEYMAPEQAKAQPVDHRADIYAFGLILYDMLLGGRLKSSAQTALEDLTRRMTTPPASAHSIDSTIPQALDRVISRCIQPDSAARYQTTAELVADLDRLDADGNPLPVLRRVTRRQVVAAGILILSLLAGTWWAARGPAPEVVLAPKSVLIADFDNQTGDPVFNGSLEQGLKIGIEGASFITAYSRSDAQALANRLKPGSRLDESMARLVSRSEGIHVILAGTISQQGSTYRITVRALDSAVDPGLGKPLATASAEAKTKAKVLEAAASLASEIREALGDKTPESAKLAAAETFTAASLDAMRAYARGQSFHDEGRYLEAITAYEEAAAFDPGFGRAYAAMGSAYGNLKRFEQAEESYKKALKLIDRMTDREKYRTLGVYYLVVSRNYPLAIKNFETLVAGYPADEGGYLNLAFAYLLVRDFDKAVAAGRKATEIQPRSVLARTNYAMYAMYAGDFKTAIREANVALKENPSFEFALITVARSSVAAGDIEGGRQAYERLAALSESGKTMARLGQADLEMYLGRYKEAAALLEAIVAAGGKSQDPEDAAPQYLALSEAYEASGKRAQAIRMADRAIELSRHESVLFPAALVLIRVGQPDKAQKVADTLNGIIQAQTSSFARLIEGEIALTRKRLGDAVESLREGQKRYDSWFAHFLLGRAYVEAKSFPEALSEFELCVKRKGEAMDVFFLDASTIRYFPPAHYWLGRAQEGVGAVDAAHKSYNEFLALRPGADKSDPLVADTQKRAGQPGPK
jgi:eukaryotic-like serine/threonine-protein kinase